ncbi:MAG: Na/Pi cotransporter family protein [Lachnospiraceae bacterium]|nr:Na/Pi cotransporter family protein [Lachnospiraceae bacterium]
MDIWKIIQLAGGLAMFIFGMNLMSDGLKLVAGSYLKKILEKLTQNKIIAMFVGAGLTALIQSSNAMCVMVVGFVNAGIMQLERSVGIIMGAKIGTTITGQLIAFNIGQIAPIIAFIGVAVTMFAKKPKPKTVGQIITSLGVLFIGLETMKESMSPLKDESWFQNLLTNFTNPILCVLIGLLFTVVIQSASASVGVLQTLAVAGVMTDFPQMFYLMLGMNVGASVAPLLASMGGRKDAKRVAIIVALFESIGMLLFLVVTQIFPQIFGLIQGTSPDPSRQVANANTIFNLVTVLCLLPSSKYLVKLSELVVRGKDKKEGASLYYINDSGYQSGTVLIGQIDQEVARMHELVHTNIKAATEAYFGKMNISSEEFDENEATIDLLNKEIISALVRTNELGVTAKEAEHAGNLYHIVTDLERIGDHAENVLGYAKQMKENKQKFSDKALRDLKELSQTVDRNFDLACLHFAKPSEDLYREIFDLEAKVDKMVEKMRARNVKRLSKMKCEATQGLFYSEILVDLERVSDHAMNIAEAAKKYEIDEEE